MTMASLTGIGQLNADGFKAKLADLVATKFLLSGVRAVDESDFFKTLPAYAGEDLRFVSDRNKSANVYLLTQECADFEHANRMHVIKQKEEQKRAARAQGGVWGETSLWQHKSASKIQNQQCATLFNKDNYRIYSTVTPDADSIPVVPKVTFRDISNWSPDIKLEFDRNHGSPHRVYSEYVERVSLTRNQCRTLLHTNVLAMQDPNHSLFMQRDADGHISINDPNHSSLQMAELVFRTYLPQITPDIGTPIPYPDKFKGIEPTGWCQTWSMFELECTIMGCKWLHDSLVAYFRTDRIKEIGGVVRLLKIAANKDPRAPQIIKDFVEEMKPHKGDGVGHALSHFVIRLALRYKKIHDAKREFPTRNDEIAATYLRAKKRHLRPRPVDYVHIEQISTPHAKRRAAGFERIMAAYITDGTQRYTDYGSRLYRAQQLYARAFVDIDN